MRIVANVTRSVFLFNVSSVSLETLIIKDTITAMAFIAESISKTTLMSIIRSGILPFEDWGKR